MTRPLACNHRSPSCDAALNCSLSRKTGNPEISHYYCTACLLHSCYQQISLKNPESRVNRLLFASYFLRFNSLMCCCASSTNG
jgi:hypothetical protein